MIIKIPLAPIVKKQVMMYLLPLLLQLRKLFVFVPHYYYVVINEMLILDSLKPLMIVVLFTMDD